MKIIAFKEVKDVEQIARLKGYLFERSHLYSLQTDLLEDVEDQELIILCGVGVRYDDVKKWIEQHRLQMYRVDTSAQLTQLLTLLQGQGDVTPYLADLRET